MRRRQLLKVAGVASGLPLASTAVASQTDGQSESDGCQLPDCIHPTLGHTVFSVDAVGDLPDDLQPDHEVSLSIRPRGDADEFEEGTIPEFFFDPTGLAIAAGDVVQFTFASPDHTVTAYHPDLGRQRRVPENVPPLSSPVLPADAAWLYRFDEPGVYDLFCAPHEVFGMVLRVVVDEPAEDFGEEAYPDRRGPELTAALVLDDEALAPQNVVDQGQVTWDDLADESKRLLVEFQEPQEGDDGGEGGGEDAEQQAGAESDGLQIQEHELVTDDLFGATVEGTVVNNTGETADFVEVTVRAYDEEGVRIETGSDITTDLADGEAWAFQVHLTSDAEEIDDYEIEVQ